MRTLDTDICEIAQIIPAAGKITCTKPLEGFHFGAGSTTESEFSVDMRAEVALLSRNIKIVPSMEDMSHLLREPWSCRILVSDFFENDAEMTHRTGSLNMDYVEVYKCGQKYTWKSAIRFENARKAGSSVTNSAIYDALAPGIMIKQSSKIHLANNIVTNFAEHGIWVLDSMSIKLDNNWVFHVIENPILEPEMYNFFAWTGGITVSERNNAMTVINNIVAGTWHHGFHYVPMACNDPNPDFVFTNNLAHSISGYGAIAMHVLNPCTEVKDFTAYKVTEASIMLGSPSGINRGKNLTAIDTHYGIGIHSANGGDAEIIDSKIYGELSENMDCPPGSPCDHCMDAMGMVLNQAAETAHEDRNMKSKMLPLFKASGSMTGHATYTNLEFINYKSSQKSCGATQYAIKPYLQPDYTPFATFKNIKLTEVAHEAFTYIQDPL